MITMNNSIKRKLGYFIVFAVALATSSCAIVDGQREQLQKMINSNGYKKVEPTAIYRKNDVSKGRIYEMQNNYKDAYEAYLKEFTELKNSSSRETYAKRGNLLKRICYCVLKYKGDYKYIDRLTEYAIQNEAS
jgi:hypothetical protein